MNSFRRATAAILAQPRHLVILRLSLLLLLLHGSTGWTLDVPLRMICGAMLLFDVLLPSRLLWLVLSFIIAMVNAHDWAWIDNHKYLITYWCMVCTLAVAAEDTDGVLAWNGRLLIGLSFTWAALWKLMAGEYFDGSFLEFTFLTDSRVETVARWLGQMSPSTLPTNRLLKEALVRFPGDQISATLTSTPALQRLALGSSYWTLLIEVAVAATFLLPNRLPAAAKLRDALLMLFIGTTYILLPVIGFALTLTIMGLAQCPRDRPRTRLAYLGMLVALQLTLIPWQRLMTEALG